MGRIILYIAQSIDGQIARKDGRVDWLDEFGDPNDYGMADFMQNIGTIVWGSKTYEQSLGFGEWMFEERITNYVMTRRSDIPLVNKNTFLFNGTAEDLVKKIRGECDMDIWLMGGGDVITQFQNAGLIDELRIFTIPLILGDGIPLWKNIAAMSKAELQITQAFPNSVVELRYNLTNTQSPQ